MAHRIGFVSTRFAGTDGVSLESAKWAEVLEELGHEVYWFAGQSDRPPERTLVDPLGFFGEPEISALHARLFASDTRSGADSARIGELADHLLRSLERFVDGFGIDRLVIQNALAIPMHVPLGVALTRLLAARGLPAIAHHHDFAWERPRFALNGVGDLLRMAFPPVLPGLTHVTINSGAQRDLTLRTGVSSTLIPNVLDFETPPPDASGARFRHSAGLADSDVVLLQPTRIVPRKGIEHAIAVASKLRDLPVKLVISHASGDEGGEYLAMLQALAAEQAVDLVLTDAHLTAHGSAGRPADGLADAYASADLVTYPSLYEGFGNALVEAFYFRQPVLVNRYPVFVSDIEPKGFRVLTMDGCATDETADQARRVLDDDAMRAEMVDHNHALARAHFGYDVLRRTLRMLIAC